MRKGDEISTLESLAVSGNPALDMDLLVHLKPANPLHSSTPTPSQLLYLLQRKLREDILELCSFMSREHFPLFHIQCSSPTSYHCAYQATKKK